MNDISDVAREPKELSLDDLKAVDVVRQVEPVDVPEWGGRVHVRELTALERDQLDETFYREDGTAALGDHRVKYVAATLCRSNGSPFFKPGDPAGVAVIATKSSAVVRRLYDVALRLNKARKEDAEAGKGGSGHAPGGDSLSD